MPVAVADFLSEKRHEITSRLSAVKPLVDEYHRLEAAALALAGIDRSSSTVASPPAPRRRGPGRPPGSKSKKPAAGKATAAAPKATAATPKATAAAPKSTPAAASKPRAAKKGRGGRRKGSGSRAAEALTHVQKNPGITIPELAAKMGIKQNYLYRVLPGLEAEKKVSKTGRGWHATSAA
jgi:hypothetical protein